LVPQAARLRSIRPQLKGRIENTPVDRETGSIPRPVARLAGLDLRDLDVIEDENDAACAGALVAAASDRGRPAVLSPTECKMSRLGGRGETVTLSR
jgi:hypothetical protein